MTTSLSIIGWAEIAIEIILLLVFLYTVFGPDSVTDSSGMDIAQFLLIISVIYITVNIILGLSDSLLSNVLAVIMGAIPISIVLIVFIKQIVHKHPVK